eukprot:superscaffoldBa00001127_g9084
MGFLQNQNLTLGFSQPHVSHWESTPQLSSAVSNTIIVLGVLTFALQLCLVLFFMLRCWRLDSKVQKALKHPDTVQKAFVPSSFQLDVHRLASYQLCDESATSSPAELVAVEEHEPTTSSLFAPSIPWDLVQR